MSENKEDILVLSGDMPDAGEPCVDGEGDILGRAPLVKRLTSIVKDAAKYQSYTISLHGDWGTGKTYLLRGWQKQLQGEYNRHSRHRPRAVYFNAWEDDFQGDALTAIVGQLWRDIKSPDWKEIYKALEKAVPAIAEKKALGFLGLEKKDLQSPAERTVDEYVAVRAKLDDFKERLRDLAAAVKSSTGFPLVFIVDELDRCRPTFAIEVLERVKHLFGAPNIVFVFGINKKVLEKSIESVYGNIDAEDYLRRFFDINLTLPPSSAKAYCLHLLTNHKDLRFFLNRRFQPVDSSWHAGAEKLLAPLVGYMGLSLRQVEHVIRLLRLAINTKTYQRVISQEAWGIALLILLKIKHPGMYEEFIAGKRQCADIINHFHGILAPHTDEQEVHRRGEPTRDAFSHVELALYRFGEKKEIMGAIQSVIEAEKATTIPDFAKIYLAKRTTEHHGSAHDIRDVVDSMDSSYWLSLKEAAVLLDLGDASRR